MRRRVDLPAPFRPTRPIRSPSSTPRDKSSKSGESPRVFDAPSMEMRFTGGL